MKELKTLEDLESVLEKSKTEMQLILKHSTQCPISSAAYDEFKSFAASNPDINTNLVYVIESRPVSNKIEEISGIRHESPQALILKNSNFIWNASHRSITLSALREAASTHN